MSPKIRTPLPLVNSEEELAACLAHVGRYGPRGGMVFWEDGQEFVKIPLTQGKYTLIDRTDYETAGQYRWHAYRDNQTWYAGRGDYNAGISIALHRFLMGFPELQIDHRNGDGLDNRRRNLREATVAENQRNRSTKKQFKGVSKYGNARFWKAQIWVNGAPVKLGSFPTADDAAFAYDLAAIRYFGEFAKLNYGFLA